MTPEQITELNKAIDRKSCYELGQRDACLRVADMFEACDMPDAASMMRSVLSQKTHGAIRDE